MPSSYIWSSSNLHFDKGLNTMNDSDGMSPCYDRQKLEALLENLGAELKNNPDFRELDSWLKSFMKREVRPDGRLDFREIVRKDFARRLKESGLKSGLICEIGGPQNSFARKLPNYKFEFLSLFPVEDRDDVIVADVTQCDYVPSERYDAIFSISVFEHISKPWLAAEQMIRMLKPGGIVYHAAPFSYFYHGAPADYWRYTPAGLELLFSSLEPLVSEFFGGNRRRDNRGSPNNRVDADGGQLFAVDAFGGWRENWFSIYCGRKNEQYLRDKVNKAEHQVIVNLVKILAKSGIRENEAIERVCEKLKTISVSHDQEIFSVQDGKGLNYTRDQVERIWVKRSKKTTRPSYSRFVMGEKVGL